MASDASGVVCRGTGLRFGYINHPICSSIDTRSAGPGELTVFCNGPEQSAFCELNEQSSGLFKLTVKAQDIGIHTLTVRYDGVDVPGSPFSLRVSAAGLVKVRGPGLRDGLFTTFKDEFVVDSQEAGPGEIKIKVGGPKGAFRLQTGKEGHRRLQCHYHPQRPGVYVLHIDWSGDPLPGSPFQVYICGNEEELKRHLAYGTANPIPGFAENAPIQLLEDDMDDNYMLRNMDDIRM